MANPKIIYRTLLFLLVIISPNFALADQHPQLSLEPIVISQTAQQPARESPGFTYIAGQEIDELPVISVPEVLEHINGVDIRQRGVFGVQSDLSIRGLGFDQTVVLIDGVKINDPQTGHFNLDLPFTLDDVEGIEVFRGGYPLFGAGAMGGAMNIITRTPKERRYSVKALFGEHSLFDTGIRIQQPVLNFKNSLSVAYKESDGYRPYTEFKNFSAFFKTQTEVFKSEAVNFSLGYIDKDFDADSFYSSTYPREKENTTTTYSQLGYKAEEENFKFAPRFYYRRHRDRYILDKTNPNLYTNYHTTYIYGGLFDLEYDLSLCAFKLGAEAGREEISSTGIGGHRRQKEALWAGVQPRIHKKVLIDIGARLDHYTKFKWEVNPYYYAGFFICDNLKINGKISRSFRLPTFTDLYYSDPANIGNPDLGTEHAWSYETGVDCAINKNINASITVFKRDARNLIDWTRRGSSSVWYAENIGEVETEGLEASLEIAPVKKGIFAYIDNLFVNYAYLDSERANKDFISKYALDFLQNQFIAGANIRLPFDVRHILRFSYKDRVNKEAAYILDARLSKKISKDKLVLEFFVDGTNLLNASYTEVADVPMPGRWIRSGIRVEF